jgi:hypothetical protein
MASFAIVIMILFGVNFDLRVARARGADAEQWIALGHRAGRLSVAMFGILYACWVLWRSAAC